jgi:two-component system chemotaxis response regulator CheY
MTNVLAVDDSKTIRDMVQFTLENAGHEVTLAEDGEQATRTLGSTPFDLIITDVNMPNMNGIELVRHVRADAVHRGTPILILTTESAADLKMQAKEAGATGWIVKPFVPEKLLQVIAKVCP